MDESIRMFGMLPPLHKEKSPGLACLLGFLFGGIGLAIYFRSFADFILPVAAFLILTVVTDADRFGVLGAAVLVGAYGYMRALHSNKQLRKTRPQT